MRNFRTIWLIAVLLILCQRGWPQDTTTLSLADRVGFARTTSGAPDDADVGYARLTSQDGNSVPSGLAIFGLRQDGVLVTEASVPASPVFTNGRIYAEVRGAVRTGIAIANPNPQPVTISFFFTDELGINFGSDSTTIQANGQIARFLDEVPFSGGSTIVGTFTFSATLPVAATALRGFTNERFDFLITTLPVANLSSITTGDIVFPHFADGGGWTTQVVLVNPTDLALQGSISFSDRITTSGLPNSIFIPSQLNTFTYSLPPRSSQRLVSGGLGFPARTGWVRIRPSFGGATPSAVVIFSFKQEGITVTEAGVASVASSSSFRIYAEASGDFEWGGRGSIQTGVVVANTGTTQVTVDLDLTTLDGQPTGTTGTITVLPGSQVAKFLYQIDGLDSLELPFQGILRVSSNGPGISVAGLRGRFNERLDFLVSTTAPIAENSDAGTELVFPHLVDGGGFVTQFVLFNAGNSSSSSTLSFRGDTGGSLGVRLLGEGATPQLLNLAQFSGSPGETLVLNSGSFVTDTPALVSFEFGPDATIRVPATSVTESEVAVLVPVFVDEITGDVTSGAASLSITQELPGGTSVYGPVDGFNIGELGSTSEGPGTILLQTIDQVLSDLDASVTQWRTIQSAAENSFDASNLLSNLQTTRDVLSSRRALVEALANGTPPPVLTGSVAGHNIFANAESFALIDRLLFAFPISPLSSAGGAQEATSSTSAIELASKEGECPDSPGCGFRTDEQLSDLFGPILRNFDNASTIATLLLDGGRIVLNALPGGVPTVLTSPLLSSPIVTWATMIAPALTAWSALKFAEPFIELELGRPVSRADYADAENLLKKAALISALSIPKPAEFGSFGGTSYLALLEHLRATRDSLNPDEFGSVADRALRDADRIFVNRNLPPGSSDPGQSGPSTDPEPTTDTDPTTTPDPQTPTDPQTPMDPQTPETPGPVATVTITPDSLTGFLPTNANVTFTVTARDSRGNIVDCNPPSFRTIRNPAGSVIVASVAPLANGSSLLGRGVLRTSGDFGPGVEQSGAASITAVCDGVASRPLLVSGREEEEEPPAGGFEGTYVGSMVGTGFGPTLGTLPSITVPLSFTISGGTLDAPDVQVNFIVPISGALNFSGTVPGVGTCSFNGQLTSTAASGSWSCLLTGSNGVSGTWSATRQ